MTRATVETVESAPASIQAELKDLEQKFGKVLNIHGAMASSLVVLQAYIALQQVIEDYGTFDAQTREAIALADGNIDECTHCQSAHTQGAQAAGLSENQTIAIRRHPRGAEPLHQLLQPHGADRTRRPGRAVPLNETCPSEREWEPVQGTGQRGRRGGGAAGLVRDPRHRRQR